MKTFAALTNLAMLIGAVYHGYQYELDGALSNQYAANICLGIFCFVTFFFIAIPAITKKS